MRPRGNYHNQHEVKRIYSGVAGDMTMLEVPLEKPAQRKKKPPRIDRRLLPTVQDRYNKEGRTPHEVATESSVPSSGPTLFAVRASFAEPPPQPLTLRSPVASPTGQGEAQLVDAGSWCEEKGRLETKLSQEVQLRELAVTKQQELEEQLDTLRVEAASRSQSSAELEKCKDELAQSKQREEELRQQAISHQKERESLQAEIDTLRAQLAKQAKDLIRSEEDLRACERSRRDAEAALQECQLSKKQQVQIQPAVVPPAAESSTSLNEKEDKGGETGVSVKQDIEYDVHSVAFMRQLFSRADEKSAGVIPKLALRRAIDRCMTPDTSDLQNLSERVRAEESTMLDMDEFLAVVRVWLQDPSAAHESNTKKQAKEKLGFGSTSKARIATPEPESNENVESLDFMLKAFDQVDTEQTGFAPRLDVRREIDKYISKHPSVRSLSNKIKKMNELVIDKDDYAELVEAWLKDPSMSPSSPEPPPSRPKIAVPTLNLDRNTDKRESSATKKEEVESLEFMLAIFDEADEDATGFVPRLEIRKRVDTYVAVHPKVKDLSAQIRAMADLVVERDDFQELVKEWLSLLRLEGMDRN